MSTFADLKHPMVSFFLHFQNFNYKTKKIQVTEFEPRRICSEKVP